MKDISKNYLTIQGWMVQDLKLNSNSLLTFALIYGFCQDTQSEFTGSINYICNWLNCSRPTVSKSLNELVELDIIIKTEKIINGVQFNTYKINIGVVNYLCRGSKETLQGVVKKLDGGSKETLHNNNKYTNKENIYINSENLTDTEKQLKAFKEVLETQPQTKKEYQDLPKYLNIDDEYYKQFIEKWNKHVLTFTERKFGILKLTPFEKNQLKIFNKPINEISEALFVLFNQEDKTSIPQCWTRPTHFLKEEQFYKYYEDAQNFKITKKVTQFHKNKN